MRISKVVVGSCNGAVVGELESGIPVEVAEGDVELLSTAGAVVLLAIVGA